MTGILNAHTLEFWMFPDFGYMDWRSSSCKDGQKNDKNEKMWHSPKYFYSFSNTSQGIIMCLFVLFSLVATNLYAIGLMSCERPY